ncbi:MAG: 2-C-methyl-D-erythritol 4-phosphate cytidylyltransferase [Dethiobacter sp.]|jgi:2-C-methyl-D-erythritol 4-phosphate cytidylyltransferase|nr:2-C-methyl-D-erythritol 4-phosphate cytidylyltransferase [Dethiobacter sp.]
MDATVIIAAAGRGLRMGGHINKQYLTLNDRPVLYYALAASLEAGCFKQLIVVVTPGEEELFRREVLLPYFKDFNPDIITGGSQRQDSVHNGLLAVASSCEIVCVHDGARPLTSPLLFSSLVQAAIAKGAAISAVPVKDTIKQVDDTKRVIETPARSCLWSVQTPQAFRRQWLLDAYRQAAQEGFYATDDAALLERCGYPVHVVEGDYNNLKITTPEDLILAEVFLRRREDANRDRL